MKTIDLHHNPLSDFANKLAAFRHKLALRNPVQLYFPKINFQLNAQSIKLIKSQLMDAAKEGLKQNLLGAEIDMEFLTLSIRTYVMAIITLTFKQNTARQISNGKPSEKGTAYYNHNNRPLAN